MESFNVKVLEELKLLNYKFYKHEANVAIARNANSLLPSRLIDRESQCWSNAQYSRRETLEIVGLPKSLTNDEAETKVCQIFGSLDCNGNKEDLDACHLLKDKERVIVKFCRRKDCDTTNLDLPEGLRFLLTKVCALTIVCFGQQAKNCMVKAESLVGSYVSNRSVKIQENSRPLYISQMENFKKVFS